MLKPNITLVPYPQWSAQTCRKIMRPVGRLWACLDRRLEDARVYCDDGKAWIVSRDDATVGHMDWFEFCHITRANRHWNLTGSWPAQVVASSKVGAV